MRLTERYRPQTLKDVKGQPAVAVLQGFCLRPYPKECFLLEGPPGCGKTSAALAMAHDLGTSEHDIHTIKGSDMTLTEARVTMAHLRFRPMFSKWSVLIIEELTKLPLAVQENLHTALETEMPLHLVCIATSNDTSALGEAFRQRFKPLPFQASQQFAKPAIERLERIWAAETGEQTLPPDLAKAGWEHGESGKRQFSLRVALDRLQLALLGRMVAA